MSKQGLNILVTGGAGFKGVMLVESLLKRGCRVTVLDNFESGYQSLLHLVHHPNLRVVQADICNTTPASTAGYDVVFHLAGIVGHVLEPDRRGGAAPPPAGSPAREESTAVGAVGLAMEFP